VRVACIVFSARQRGNCWDCADFLLGELRRRGFDGEIINICEYDVKPCSRCEYECFSKTKKCPVRDDAKRIYEKLEKSHGITFVAPTYGGTPPALFFAFKERAQMLDRKTWKRIWDKKVLSFVVLGNERGASVLDVIITPWEYWKNAFSGMSFKIAGYELIQPRRAEKGDTISGGIIQDELIQQRLKSMAKSVVKCLQSL